MSCRYAIIYDNSTYMYGIILLKVDASLGLQQCFYVKPTMSLQHCSSVNLICMTVVINQIMNRIVYVW